MIPNYQDNHITVWNKSCTDMSELPDESVQCVVTSPPQGYKDGFQQGFRDGHDTLVIELKAKIAELEAELRRR